MKVANVAKAPAKATSKIVTITPTIAKAMLANNPDFNASRLNKRTAKGLATEMLEGRWVFNGQSLLMDQNGLLLNGQHRLNALIIANVAADFNVVYSVSDTAYPSLDQGMKRSLAHILRSKGYKYATTLGTVLKGINAYIAGEVPSGSGTHVAFSPNRALEMMEMDGKLFQDSSLFAHKHRYDVDMTMGAIGIVYYILCSVNKKQGIAFMESFVTGNNLTGDSPILKLRNLLRKKQGKLNLSKGGRLNRGYTIGIAIKAWNATRGKGTFTDYDCKSRDSFPQAV